MDALRATQTTLHAVLRGELAPESAADTLGCDPRRLSIYRNFVRDHVLSVLQKNHPLTFRLLGDAAGPLAEAFFARHPATSWELNRAAEAFADFLEQHLDHDDDPGDGLPTVPAFAVALARFEWECFAAYVDPERLPQPAGLARPVVNPTLRALHFDFPVVRWVLDQESAGDTADLPSLPQALAEPELVFVFRKPERLVAAYYTASDALLFALKVVLETTDLQDAADETGESLEHCEALLQRAAGLGLILLPTGGSSSRPSSGPGREPA